MTKKIYLYGTIGAGGFWDDPSDFVSAKKFRKLMDEAENDDIDLYVNSAGGDVFDGMTIKSIIERYPGKVVAHVDGLAASAASFCIMSADEVRIAPGAMMMVHNASAWCNGNAKDHRDIADVLEKTNGSIRSIYARKTSLDDEKLAELMDAETWMDADECVEYGFADALDEAKNVEAHCPAQIMNTYHNVPERISQAISAQSGGVGDGGIGAIDAGEDPTCKALGTISTPHGEAGAAEVTEGPAYAAIDGAVYRIR